MATPYQSTVRNLTSPRQPQGRDSLFSWTVGLFVFAGVVVVCWLGSFYVTGHPEQPTMYSILRSANQVGAQARFETTAAPQGKFLSAKDAFDSFSQMTSLQLDHENAKLLRNYIRNYKDLSRPVPYLHGKFVVIQAYSLSKSDFIAEGLVVLTQAVDHPQVWSRSSAPHQASNQKPWPHPSPQGTRSNSRKPLISPRSSTSPASQGDTSSSPSSPSSTAP